MFGLAYWLRCGTLQRSYSTSSQVSTEMGDSSRVFQATQANSAWSALHG